MCALLRDPGIRPHHMHHRIRRKNARQDKWNADYEDTQNRICKIFLALSSSCAFNIVYRVADPTPIIDPMAKIRLYTGSTRFNTVIPSVPAACEIKNVSTII